jgi:uncharacterized protein YfaS (alpha-2-macroglobulin family)
MWVRNVVDRSYRPAEAGLRLQISVQAPNYHTIRTLTLETDDSGSVSGSFSVGTEAPLGEYQLLVRDPGNDNDEYAGRFRIEEYKSPEFEVTVSPAKTVAQPGEPVSALIRARYYFGSPVSDAEVHYRIFREDHDQAYAMPAEFDWLYGAGYSSTNSTGSGLGTNDEWVFSPGGWFDLYWDYRRHRRHLIDEGRTRLDAHGLSEIRIDPGAWKLDTGHDSRYIIEVEVRDEGRRTVAGTGSVAVPWREFHVFAQLDRGWYAPGDSIVVDLNARSPNGVPVAVAGKAILSRWEGPGDSLPNGKQHVQEFDVALGVDGHYALNLSAPAVGRYEVEFRTRDSRGGDVSAAVDFWIYRPGTDLGRSRPPALQIVPDRRTYRVGDTARLLIVAAAADAHVLICDPVHEYRFLNLANHAQILDYPIDDKAIPDLIVEGTVVWQGEVHTETRRLLVPPVRDLLQVEISTDKTVYRPGETGNLKLKVTDRDGRPVRGDLALTAFDKAVTYIQPESELGPKSFIAARKSSRWYWMNEISHTLDPRRFETSGVFMCPEYYLTDDYVPQIGGMGGAPPVGGDPSDIAQPPGGLSTAESMEEAISAAAPTIRSDFSDTALWRPHIQLDESGMAETEIKFPESLTTWRIRGYLVTKETRVGDLARDIVTTKKVLVRLQRPRFLVERDEVVLSAIVHNQLNNDKFVTAELLVPAAMFQAADAGPPDAEGNLRLSAQAQVPSGGQHRFDWTLAVVGDGLATMTVKALTDDESDAMRTAIPVRTHGTLVRATQTGALAAGEMGAKTLAFDVPADADPRKMQLSLSLAPTPASAAFEAIPYLVGYPYGCVEQTMSRFYPTVLAARTLKQLGIDAAQLVENSRAREQPSFRGRFPEAFLDAAELQRMTEAGLQRLQRFQHDDGGWGWWEHDQSSPYMTAYVLIGLHVAAECGAEIDELGFDRARTYLATLEEWKQQAGMPASRTLHTQMMMTYALALNRPASFGPQEDDVRRALETTVAQRLNSAFDRRDSLPLYDRSLLALALHIRSSKDRAAAVLQEILQAIEVDDQRSTAHVPVAARQYWHSWNSETETNAWLLRALVAIDPENPFAPKIVNWLALNRKQGRFWRSTQETALAVTAISEYLIASGAGDAERSAVVRLDNGPSTTVRISASDILGREIALAPPLDQSLAPGRHEITVSRRGTGSLNYGLHTEFLRTTVPVIAEGNGIAITRRYFKAGLPSHDPAAAAKAVSTGPLRRQLAQDDTINTGDMIEVELTIQSDEDFEYVAFEDMKPAGCEPVQIQSGATFDNDLWANVELRDDRVVFFASYLGKGTHILRYKLRAETPGRFHALPARGFAMYAPEIHARSGESRLQVRD